MRDKNLSCNLEILAIENAKQEAKKFLQFKNQLVDFLKIPERENGIENSLNSINKVIAQSPRFINDQRKKFLAEEKRRASVRPPNSN